MMKLKDTKFISDSYQKRLSKLKINELEDLITYYPYRYQTIRRSDVAILKDNDPIIMDGTLVAQPIIRYYQSRKSMITTKLLSTSFVFSLIFYNQGYLKNKLKIGSKVTVKGKYKKQNNTIVVNELSNGVLTDMPVIESNYHLTEGLSNKMINKFINIALQRYFPINYIPDYLEETYHFVSKLTAVKEIHNPTSKANFKQSLIRLKYEELFVYMLKVNHLKHMIYYSDSSNKIFDETKIAVFISNLPFVLTDDQNTAIKEILNDLKNKRRMNRLLQGDVGSGKTIVGFIVSYACYLAGFQTAMMVPTEILAQQHYKNAMLIFNNYDLEVGLLTANTKNKSAIYNKISKGKIDFLIGTHAILNEKISYNKLGLVIIDEQHRFGVQQRSNLKNKDKDIDVLAMSATPIPRTYALTIYGDMDISSIKTKPMGRQPTITYLKQYNDMLEILTLMNRELKQHHQIYIVGSRIDEESFVSINWLYDSMMKAFGKKYNIGIIHGKMATKEKEEVMLNFSDNKINILIATTVIEVGVNVSNATMMIVFDSDKFGLSTLHQLRGRVGRGELASYCIFIYKTGYDRLKVLEDTSDGFLISEADFKNRGQGDLFGVQQSGSVQFKLVDISKDYKILVHAGKDAADFYQQYFNDSKYLVIKEKVLENSKLN